MDILVILIIVVLLLSGGFIIYKNNQIKKVNQIRKKSDIENRYINQLRLMQTKEEKLAFIKQCNSELARNIFFTKVEANALVQRLINL